MRHVRDRVKVVVALLTVCVAAENVRAQSVLEPLVSLSAEGGQPLATLTPDSHGDLIGSTSSGGVYGRGSIYRLTAASGLTSLETIHSFRGPDGQLPRGEVLQAADGAYYGVTIDGGAFQRGSIYRLDTTTTPATLTVLWSFDGGTLGASPAAGLVDAANGHFYGTTLSGGGIFDLDLTASPPSVALVADFANAGIVNVENRLLRVGGAFFGTAGSGGGGYGAIFRFDPGATPPVTVLHAFADWANPYSGLTDGPDGLLYGANFNGGSSNVGAIFRFDPNVSPIVIETIASFDPGVTGANPRAQLLHTGGALYGTTFNGGQHGSSNGGGTVYRVDLTPFPQLSVVQSLHPQTMGSVTYAGVTSVGSLLYVPVNTEGPSGMGSIISVDPGMPESATVLHTFGYGRSTGATPLVAPLETEPGVFFGTTIEGGMYRKGTLYRLDTRVTPVDYQVVHSFATAESAFPMSALVIGVDGFVYGGLGGTQSAGAVFRFDPAANPIQVEIVQSVAGSVEDLLAGSDGAIYGITSNGGPASVGTVFRILPNIATPSVEVIHAFDVPASGQYPAAAPVQLPDGRLLGTTYGGGDEGRGTIYSLTPTAPAAFVREYSFTDADLHVFGVHPYGLTITATGRVVGMTTAGSGGVGAGMFAVDPSVTPMTVSRLLDPWTEMGRPSIRLSRGAAGELYGTSDARGSYNSGYIYRLNPSGATFVFERLSSFDPSTTGQYPRGGVVQGSDGALYGTTQSGGEFFGGVIFRMRNVALSAQLVTPNGGERVLAGIERTVRWTSTGEPNDVTIQLSRNNGGTWTNVPGCTFIAGTRTSCLWMATGPATTQALLRIVANGFPQAPVSDVSDAVFTISTATPTITVTAPNTAVTWAIGTTRTITWNHNLGAETEFRVAISYNGSTWTHLTHNAPAATPTTGSYSWLVTGPETQGAVVRVESRIGHNDVGNVPFTIAAPTVTVTAPNTAVTWQSGTSRTISFTHNLGAGQPVALELSRDSGASWTLLTTATTTTSTSLSFAWPVTGPTTNAALVRARWIGSPGVADVSDTAFTIRSLVTLQSPNTAVTWTAGTLRTVSWTHALPPGATVDIDVSLDGGATWQGAAVNIANATSTTGSAAVRMPATVTSAGRVRVRPTGNLAEGDVSDVPFSLAAPRMTVTIPNTAVAWRISQARALRWTHNLGSLEFARVDVSRDDGATWTTIAVSVPLTNAATESYTWLVDGPVSPAARIRVVWVQNPAVVDASDVSFAIQSGVTVTAPNSALAWAAGSLRTVTWTHILGVGATFDVAVSADNGVSWTDVATGVAAESATTGRAVVRLPDTVSAQALVRVAPNGQPAAGDLSNMPFQLVPPQVTVTAPNTNVLWLVGTTRSITWSHNLGTGEAVDIEVSRTNGASWETVASAVLNPANTSGTFSWVVTGPASSTAVVRVRWVSPAATADVSNVPFRIQ